MAPFLGEVASPVIGITPSNGDLLMKVTLRRPLEFLSVTIISILVSAGPMANAADPFYQGKTIKVLVSSPPGGGTDTVARLVSRFLPKYLPGNPETYVQNMPAGGGLLANNYFYRVPEPDGLTLFGTSSGPMTLYNRGGAKIKYNPREYIWIGSVSRGGSILMLRTDAKTRLLDPKAEPVVVGDREGNRTWLSMTLWGKEALGWNTRYVIGYAGTSEMVLALRQGEIEMWSSGNAEIAKGLRKDGLVEFIAQQGSERRKDFPNVPTYEEFLGDKRPTGISWKAYKIWSGPAEVDKPLAAPPGTPDKVVTLLRKAYQKMVKDMDFIKQANRFLGTAWFTRGGEKTSAMVLESTEISKEAREFLNNIRKKNGLPTEHSG